jgi:hypothetical protein
MHVTPSGGHAGLAGLQGGLSIDLLLAALLLAVTALMLLLVLAILTKSVAGG